MRTTASSGGRLPARPNDVHAPSTSEQRANVESDAPASSTKRSPREAVAAFSSAASEAWPALPFLAFGVWMAWGALTYSGSFWLSDNEINGAPLSRLYVFSTIAGGLTLLALAWCAYRSRQTQSSWQKTVESLSSGRLALIGGVVAGLGALVIVLLGPYYLGVVMGKTLARTVIIRVAYVMTGVGTALMGIRCLTLFGTLPPRKAIAYISATQIATAFLYFMILGVPSPEPIEHGPSLLSIIGFTCLPVLAALLACIKPTSATITDYVKTTATPKTDERIPSEFWRFVAFAFTFNLVIALMRSTVVASGAPSSTLDGNSIAMLFQVIAAFLLMAYAVGSKARGAGLERACSLLAVVLALICATASALGESTPILNILAQVTGGIFRILLVCMLSFICAQGLVPATIVFGTGYGLYMLGSGIGWAIGFFMLPAISSSIATVIIYLISTALMLFLAIVVFSDRIFERLFSGRGGKVPSLDELFDAEERAVARTRSTDTGGENAQKQGRFIEVTESLGREFRLSSREVEALRYLAMGYSSERISEEMGVSVNTARVHVRNVYVKLDVHSRDDVMRFVDMRMGR